VVPRGCKWRRNLRAREDDETHWKVVVPPPRAQLLDAKVQADAVRALPKRMLPSSRVDEGEAALPVLVVAYRQSKIAELNAMILLQIQVECAKWHLGCIDIGVLAVGGDRPQLAHQVPWRRRDIVSILGVPELPALYHGKLYWQGRVSITMEARSGGVDLDLAACDERIAWGRARDPKPALAGVAGVFQRVVGTEPQRTVGGWRAIEIQVHMAEEDEGQRLARVRIRGHSREGHVKEICAGLPSWKILEKQFGHGGCSRSQCPNPAFVRSRVWNRSLGTATTHDSAIKMCSHREQQRAT